MQIRTNFLDHQIQSFGFTEKLIDTFVLQATSPLPVLAKTVNLFLNHPYFWCTIVHNNRRNDHYSSTAYWYQLQPHKKFQALPPVSNKTSKKIME